MTFNMSATQRISRFRQYDRIDDLITCKLGSNKCPIFRQFLVDEFYFSAVFKCLDPLFIWHFCTSSAHTSSFLILIGLLQQTTICWAKLEWQARKLAVSRNNRKSSRSFLAAMVFPV